MKTIIISGSANKSLNHLVSGKAVGLLHFINKPLINFTIEAIEDSMGLSKYFLQGTVEQVKNVTEMAQIYLHWFTSLQLYPNIVNNSSEDILWLRDDVLYNLDFKELLAQLKQGKKNITVVNEENDPVMFYQHSKCQTTKSILPIITANMTTESYCNDLLKTYSWEKQTIISSKAFIIDSVISFHHLSMKALNGELKHLVLDYHQAGKTLIKGSHVNCELSSQQQQKAYLGDSSYVHADSQLLDDVILCKNSYIDSYVDIRNSIVLPDVYIGPYLKIDNAVVTGKAVIHIDTGNIVPIIDKKIITEILLRAG